MEEQSAEGTRQKFTGETCAHFLEYLKTEGEAGKLEVWKELVRRKRGVRGRQFHLNGVRCN